MVGLRKGQVEMEFLSNEQCRMHSFWHGVIPTSYYTWPCVILMVLVTLGLANFRVCV